MSMLTPSLNWRQLVSIEVGGAICLPVILVGHKLFQTYGLASALVAVAVGNLLLFGMALLFAEMSFRNKLSTTDNATHYFGPLGVQLFALTLMIAKCSWFAIQLEMMAEVVGGSLGMKLALGGGIILIAIFGLKALTLFSSLSMPILIGTMGYAFYGSLEKEGAFIPETLSYEGISVAVAAAITAVVDMPTYFSSSRSIRDSRWAVVLFILVAVPLIEGLGIYLSYKNPGLILSETSLWFTLFFLLAGWTTNNTNLYSSATCLGTLLPKIPMGWRQVAMGSVGILLCVLDIPKHFVLVLQLLGAGVVSMGMVILISYLVPIDTKRWNLLPWIAGTTVGVLSALKWITISTLPLIDAALVACVFTCVMRSYALFKSG